MADENKVKVSIEINSNTQGAADAKKALDEVKRAAGEMSGAAEEFIGSELALEESLKSAGNTAEKTSEQVEKVKDKTKETGEEFGKQEAPVNSFRKCLDQFSTVWGKMCAGFVGGIGLEFARQASQLPTKIFACVEAFGEQELAMRKLSAVLQASGQDVSSFLPQMAALASEIQRVTTVGDEAVLSIQGVATAMGVMAHQMDDVMRGAIGLSKSLGMDLNTATKASAAAIQGKTELLSRYIPVLSECKTDAEKLALVEKKQAEGWQVAKAETETLLGALEQLKNTFGDLQEVVGEALAPQVKMFTEIFKFLCDFLNSSPALVKTLIVALEGGIATFAIAKFGVIDFTKSLYAQTVASIKAASGIKMFSGALKGLMTTNVAIFAITAALGALVNMYMAASEKRKEWVKSIAEAGEKERENIQAEARKIDGLGLSETGQKQKLSQIKERKKALAEENKELTVQEHVQERLLLDSDAAFGRTIEQTRRIMKARAEAREQREQNFKTIAELEKVEISLRENSANLEKKNAEQLLILKKQIAAQDAEQAEKERAKLDLAYALELSQKKLLDIQKQIAEINSIDGSGAVAVDANKIAEQRKSLLEEQAKKSDEIKNIQAEIVEKEKEALNLRKAFNNNAAELEILKLQAAGNVGKAKAAELQIHINSLADDYKNKFAEFVEYKNDSAKLDEHALAYAKERFALETQIASNEAAKNRQQIEIETKLLALNVAREQALLEGNDAQVKALDAQMQSVENERKKLDYINDYKSKFENLLEYQNDSAGLEAAALAYAENKLSAEAKILDIQKQAGELALQRNRNLLNIDLQILKAKADGNKILADSLEYHKKAVALAEQYKMPYEDALKTILKIDALNNKKAPSKKSEDAVFEKSDKVIQRIQKELQSESRETRRRAEEKKKAYEDQYGIGLDDDVKNYKGRDRKTGQLIDPKVGKEFEAQQEAQRKQAGVMAARGGDISKPQTLTPSAPPLQSKGPISAGIQQQHPAQAAVQAPKPAGGMGSSSSEAPASSSQNSKAESAQQLDLAPVVSAIDALGGKIDSAIAETKAVAATVKESVGGLKLSIVTSKK